VATVPALRRDPSPLADLRALWQIFRLLRRQRPAILHTHSAKAGILGRWAGWLAGVPVIVHTPHGHVLYGYTRGLQNWAYRMAERVSAPITDCLVALSEGEKRESVAAGIGREERWVVIPSGVDVDDLSPRRAGRDPSAPLRIGCVARLEHVKGIDVLVRAAAVLGAADLPEFEIEVWGDGRQRDELLTLRDAVAATHGPRFVGTEEPVEQFLRRLDVYVQPSRNEGMGRALVLAQGVGLPVVASRVCGIPDVVKDGETGILVDAESPAALAEAIACLVLDEERRNAFGDAARSWIMTKDESGFPRFSTAAMLWHLQRLYRQLARER
jgi:glycosyltransferase involved in cell wall biosynthesis